MSRVGAPVGVGVRGRRIRGPIPQLHMSVRGRGVRVCGHMDQVGLESLVCSGGFRGLAKVLGGRGRLEGGVEWSERASRVAAPVPEEDLFVGVRVVGRKDHGGR